MREKWPLIVGLCLPILLVIFVVVTSYIPSMLVKPQYNFLYTDKSYDYDAKVINNKLQLTQTTVNYNNNYYYKTPVEPTFYVYDQKTNSSKTISSTEAQSLKLDSSNKSPDGFTVGTNDSSYSYFPFFYGGNRGGYYLQGKGLNKKIDSTNYNFNFVGWII